MAMGICSLFSMGKMIAETADGCLQFVISFRVLESSDASPGPPLLAGVAVGVGAGG